MHMPHKEPSTWIEIYRQWSSGEIPITGAALAIVIAMLRVAYGGGGWKETLLEGSICGLLTLALSSTLEYFGVHPNLTPAIGGAIGFIGVKQVRAFALRYVSNKLDTGAKVDGEK